MQTEQTETEHEELIRVLKASQYHDESIHQLVKWVLLVAIVHLVVLTYMTYRLVELVEVATS